MINAYIQNKILDKYDESIKLTYNHTYRMLVHLKNITDNFNKIENSDDITIEVYTCDIVFLDSLNENIEKQISRDGVEIYCKI